GASNSLQWFAQQRDAAARQRDVESILADLYGHATLQPIGEGRIVAFGLLQSDLLRLPAAVEQDEDTLLSQRPLVAKDTRFVIRHPRRVVAAPQNRMRLPQRDDPLIEGAHRFVPFRFLPGHGAAVVGVASTLQPDLVAIVDAGNARIGHLEENGLPLPGRVPL